MRRSGIRVSLPCPVSSTTSSLLLCVAQDCGLERNCGLSDFGVPQDEGSGSSGKEEEDHPLWVLGVLVWWGQREIPLCDYIKAIKLGF